SCRQSLAEWDELSAAAADLRAGWNSPDLWPRIRSSIAAAATPPRGRLHDFRLRPLLEIAAVLITILTLGGVLRSLLDEPASDRARFERWVLREQAIQEVERAERSHVASIERLSRLVDADVETHESPLAVSYREKLILLDEAIAECETQIRQNRYNTHLREQLLAVYAEKQRTLQELAREQNVQNP
ncbi:MAG TPA: hypothetical protein VM534_06590, partial [Thermoanaerobaculia bacterium]|nr:hypothetical protein [Thermoanaerobaculia bacterium]